jgi:hypothetical protein
MSPCIIELNDIAVVASRDKHEPVSSPGYALVQGASLVVGDEARSQARLHPQQLNNRFWQRLSMDPLSHTGYSVRHNADLAYAHLMQLHELAGEPDEVVFVAPGNYTNKQLSILLGVASQCPFQAVGLVDAAVAAAAGVELSGDIIHIDLQLHQAVLTRLKVSGDITRDTVQTVEGAGLLSLYDRWAHIIADAFIEQCRFDPLHSATTEQFIYDRLPQFLMSDGALLDFEVPQGSSVHRARIERDSILQIGSNLWRQLLDRVSAMSIAADGLVLGHNWSAIPGVKTFSSGKLVLNADTTARVCQEQIKMIRSKGEAISFITRLPGMKGSLQTRPVTEPGLPPGSEAAAPPGATPATHILINSTAYPLSSPCFLQETDHGLGCRTQRHANSQCTFFAQNGQILLQILDDARVWLNSRAFTADDPAPALTAGDALSLTAAGQQAKLIQVSTDGET